MESDGSTVTNDRQNNNEKALILNNTSLHMESQMPRMMRRDLLRQRHQSHLLCTFLVLFVALFLVMTTMFVMEKRRQAIEESQRKHVFDQDPSEVPTSKRKPRTTVAPAAEVCKSVDCILTITGQ